MCRGDRNALKFLKLMWDWVTFEGQEIEITDKNGGVRRSEGDNEG
jgi:hypothetical protein